MNAGGAIRGPQTWTDIRLRYIMVKVKDNATDAGGERDLATHGQLVNHVCREQRRPQPRVLVRDRDYDYDIQCSTHRPSGAQRSVQHKLGLN